MKQKIYKVIIEYVWYTILKLKASNICEDIEQNNTHKWSIGTEKDNSYPRKELGTIWKMVNTCYDYYDY